MALLDGIARRLGYTKAQVANAPAWLRADAESAQYSIPDRALPEAQLEIYQRLSWVQIAVAAVAEQAATTKFNVMAMDGEDTDAIENHPFEMLLRKPNPLHSRFEFLVSTVSCLALTGNCYWWLNRSSEKNTPDELWVLPPHKVKPIPDGRMFLRGYMYEPDAGVKVPLEAHEVVHFRKWHPLNTFVGLSPIESLATDVEGEMAMQRWNTNLFAKDNAKVPGALAFADPINDSDWARMKDEIKREHGGTKRSLMMLRNVGQGGVQWVQMAMSQNDMQFLQARTFTKEEIFAIYAPGLSSILAVNATEANSVAGKSTFIGMGVYPKLVQIAEKITNDILPSYGDNLVGEFEDIRPSDRLLALQEQQAAERVHTVDEIRQKFYNEQPIGDERGALLVVETNRMSPQIEEPAPEPMQQPFGNLPPDKPQDEAQQQSQQDKQTVAQQEEDSNDSKPQNETAKRAEVKAFKAWLKKRPQADIHTFKAEYLSHDELHDIASDIRGVATEQPFFTLPETFTRESVKALILQLSPDDDEAEQKIRMGLEGKISDDLSKSLEQWLRETLRGISDDEVTQIASRLRDKSTTFRDVLQRALVDSVDLGVSVSVSQLENVGFGFDWTLANSSARDWARQYTDNLMSRLNITNDRVVGEAVARWVDNGEPLSSLRTDLSQYFSRKRADLIASTEVTRAYAEGSSIAFRESGVVDEIEWRTASDELVCPTCGPLNGKRKRIGESFDIMFSVPPAHPRCRCWIVPVVNSVQNENQKNLLPNDIKPSLAVANNTKKLKPNIEHALESIDKTHGDGSLNSVPVVEKSFKNSRLGGQMTYSGNQVERIEMNSTASQSVSDASGFTFSHEFGHVIDVNVLKLEKAFKENRIKGIDLPEHIKKWDDAVKNSSHYQRLKELRYKSKTIDLDVDGEKRSFPVDKKYVNYLMQENELWARSYSQFVAKRSSSKELMSQMKNVSDFAAYPFQWNDDDFLEVEKAIEGVFVALGWLK